MLRHLFPASLAGAALLTGSLTVAHAGPDTVATAMAQPVHYLPDHTMNPAEQPAAQRARLGVAISGLTQAELDAMAQEYGVRVEQVMPGSVAERAGVRPGDVVTAVDERPAYSPARLQHLVDVASDRATLGLVREGAVLRLSVVFAEEETTRPGGRAMLGVRIQEMTRDLKEAFGAQGDLGVLISEVQDGSAADQAGLRAGDVLVHVGDQEISRVPDVLDALSGHAPGDTLDVTLLRDGSEARVQVALTGTAASESSVEAPHHPHHHGHGQKYGYGDGHPGHGYRHGHGHYGHGSPGGHGMRKPGHACGHGAVPHSS